MSHLKNSSKMQCAQHQHFICNLNTMYYDCVTHCRHMNGSGGGKGEKEKRMGQLVSLLLHRKHMKLWSHEFYRSGGVKLSSVLSCLCAGVKVLYGAREEEEEEEEEEEGRRMGQLVSLSSIHATLWGHSEFHDIMYSSATDSPHKTLAAKRKYFGFSFNELLCQICVKSPNHEFTLHFLCLLIDVLLHNNDSQKYVLCRPMVIVYFVD